MLEQETVGVSIAMPWQRLYDTIHAPEYFETWASGMSQAPLERDGDAWKTQGPQGPVRITFTPRNDLGVMDHHVDVGGGVVVHVPMRVVANDEGATVLITVFRQPEMDDATFRADLDTVRGDLDALKHSIA